LLHERIRACETSNDPNFEDETNWYIWFSWPSKSVQFYKFYLYFRKHLEPGFISLV
jgi:hypothetical protein